MGTDKESRKDDSKKKHSIEEVLRSAPQEPEDFIKFLLAKPKEPDTSPFRKKKISKINNESDAEKYTK